MLFKNSPKDWKTSTLGAICVNKEGIQTGPFGSQLHSSDYVKIGTPIITVEHLLSNRISHKNTPKVSDFDKERLSKFILRKGDIVFSRVGSVDRRSLVRDAETGWLFSGRCLRVRPDKSKIDPTYLSYYLGHSKIKNHIRSIAVGATMPSLNTNLLSGLEVLYPPNIKEQNRISHILGTLDEKIELIRNNNETLEEIAQSLFKSWFIDFDPVKAKAEGRSTGLPDEISDLFPDSFEDSDVGKIPKGWEYCLSSDLYDISIGKTPPRKESCWFSQSKDDIPWVSIKDMGNNSVYALETSEFLTKDAVYNFNIKIVPEETVIISFKLTVGRVLITPTRMLTNEAIAHFVSSKNQIPSSYSYCLFSNFDFRSLGSTSSIATAVNSKMLREMKILDPLFECKQAFDNVCNPLFQKIKQSLNESKVLEEIRDFLLLKLISGELRITDAEKMIDEVGI
nr:restriction endonuclease subunit S [Prochlorococcus marinus]